MFSEDLYIVFIYHYMKLIIGIIHIQRLWRKYYYLKIKKYKSIIKGKWNTTLI